MGKISRKQMNAVDDAIEISLGLRIPEDTEAP